KTKLGAIRNYGCAWNGESYYRFKDEKVEFKGACTNMTPTEFTVVSEDSDGTITIPSINNFTPSLSGNNVTLNVSGTAAKYWVYIMRSNSAPNAANSTQYIPVQSYDSSFPQDNVFYRAKISTAGI